jgi:hypothetical protein
MYPKKQKFRKFNKLYTSQQTDTQKKQKFRKFNAVPEPATDSSEDVPEEESSGRQAQYLMLLEPGRNAASCAGVPMQNATS